MCFERIRNLRVSGLKCNVSKCEALALGTGKIEPLEYNCQAITWVEEITVTGVIFSKNTEQCRDKNFSKCLKNLETHLNMWKQRDLSLIGKVQIIKTFGVSQLQYIMSMVTPTPEIIGKATKLLNRFLWGSNINKIKHTACIAPYNEGGLNMPDVQTIVDSQRVSWIKRFFCTDRNTQWNVFFEWQFEKLGGLNFFHNSNIATRDVQNRGLISFYESIAVAWCKFFTKGIDEDNNNNILSMSLFLNTQITTCGKLNKSLFYPKLIKKGIIFINDIIDQRCILSPEQIKIRYNLTGIETFEYISVCKSIRKNPLIMEKIQSAGINCIFRNTKDIISCENQKTVYRALIKKISTRPTSEGRLQSFYTLNSEQIVNAYKLPFLVTIETKLRSFQFNFNHLIFYTNKMLHDRKITTNSPLCTFCNKEEETLDHLFIDCPSILPLWNELELILSYTFSRQEKIFGCYDNLNNNHFDIISHCSLLLKYYVHICRLNKNTPNTKVLVKRIQYASDLELSIATRKNKTDRHHQKWSPYLNFFLNDVIDK